MVRNDLLVCPVMHQQSVAGGHRSIYLPQPDSWYKFNLRIDNDSPRHHGVPLEKRIPGGSKFEVDAHIASEPAFLANITPMFVREGMSPPSPNDDGSALTWTPWYCRWHYPTNRSPPAHRPHTRETESNFHSPLSRPKDQRTPQCTCFPWGIAILTFQP